MNNSDRLKAYRNNRNSKPDIKQIKQIFEQQINTDQEKIFPKKGITKTHIKNETGYKRPWEEKLKEKQEEIRKLKEKDEEQRKKWREANRKWGEKDRTAFK